MLLTREEFNKQVFTRDDGRCVVCGEPAVDAHHIFDRKLFTDNGYYLDNGASVCATCHLSAENGDITPQELMALIGIKSPVLENGHVLDKWGNSQKYFKYPRTYHFPWSEGLQNDDKMMENPNQFEGKEVVVTVKMDGENTTMYPDFFHARSLDSRHHPSRNYVKGIHGSIKYLIPEGWRVCGENLYAEHAIKYKNLSSYFQVFSVWTNENKCLSWVDTVNFCKKVGLEHVTAIYMGLYNESAIREVGNKLMTKGIYGDPAEGYVVRLAESFHYNDFANSMGKCVRKGHVGNDDIHWMSQWNESMVNKLG
jgi:hypothetical protein